MNNERPAALSARMENLQTQVDEHYAALKEIIQILKANETRINRGIDVVDFGDYRLFMFTNDNLYDRLVDDSAKHFSLDGHYRNIASSGYDKSPVDRSNSASVEETRWGLYILLLHLIDNCQNLAFIDVGSFVGDVAVRYANFFRTIDHHGKVICFDPTVAGGLVPHNAAFNGLENIIEYHPVAVSHINGPLLFAERSGHTDSSHSTLVIEEAPNTIYSSIRLSDFIAANKIGEAFIKLDAEGLDFQIIEDIKPFLDKTGSSFAFEYIIEKHHSQKNFVIKLMETHFLLDVGYLQHPSFFNLVQADNLDSYIADIMTQRPHGFTDMVAVSKKTPMVDKLIDRLVNLPKHQVQFRLA